MKKNVDTDESSENNSNYDEDEDDYDVDDEKNSETGEIIEEQDEDPDTSRLGSEDEKEKCQDNKFEDNIERENTVTKIDTANTQTIQLKRSSRILNLKQNRMSGIKIKFD